MNRKLSLCFCLVNQVISMYGMNLWFRAYGITLSALTANLTMIPKGVTLRVSLNFNALVGRATVSKFRLIASALQGSSSSSLSLYYFDALALACRDKTLTSIENVYFCRRKRLIHIA